MSDPPASETPIHIPNDTASSPPASQQQHQQPSIRSSLGSVSTTLSDAINQNLAVARSAALAATGLLAAYGLAQTPLFFRYRTVSELPSHYFRSRQTLSCRLVKAVVPAEHTNLKHHPTAIYAHVRHLSPAETLLPLPIFQQLMKMHPTVAITGSRHDEQDRELMMIQIAGIERLASDKQETRAAGKSLMNQISIAPTLQYSLLESAPYDWLSRMAANRARVSCQLIGRITRPEPEQKGPIKQFLSKGSNRSSTDDIAVVKLYYRPNPLQVFSSDVAETLVRDGRATVSERGLCLPVPSHQIVADTSGTVRDAQRDADYLQETLEAAEFEAIQECLGMWSDEQIREARADEVEEVAFRTTAPLWKKVWRWMRGG